MPHAPLIAPHVATMPGSVFSRLAHRIAQYSGERFPLHVGDTYLSPPVGARMQDLREEDHPGLHTYPPPTGLDALVERIAVTHRVQPRQVLVTAGATGGWHAVAATVLSPGDEVAVLAPYWPLFPGIVRAVGGVPVDVRFFEEDGFVPGTTSVRPLTPDVAIARIEAARTPRTVAIYVNSPNNPTGTVLSREVLDAIVAYARMHNLWIWSDDVYALYAYNGDVVPLLELAPERTFSVHSFSKAHGLAGARVGYVLSPDHGGLRDELRKMAMHAWYSAPRPAQVAAMALLDPTIGPPWVAEARRRYQEAGNAAADRLRVPRPDGGTFLFVDVRSALGPGPVDEALHSFLIQCVDRGLILAPGVSCGQFYTTHVRLCFTCAPPETVARGVEILAELLENPPCETGNRVA